MILAQLLEAQVTSPVPGTDATASQVAMYLAGAGGVIGAAWVAVKAVTAWVANQMTEKDRIIAAKDAEISRLNTESDRRIEAMQGTHDLRYEALRKECAGELKTARTELVGILREGSSSGTQTPLPKEPS